MATGYNINYDDEQFKQVEADKTAALNEVNNTYNNMINQSDKFYQDQINAAKDYANEQSKIQQANTDFAIEQINQQKAQAEKDYTKEQKASYVDWQKQSNQYGANAEQMAASGLTNTGFSESSQVSMYNQYQGRVATARESFNQAVLNYNNSIQEAKLANNSKLAEIGYNALKTQLELSLQGFQYKNSLLEAQMQQKQQTEDRYYSRWQDVLNQMNTEKQFAESVRQYEQNYQFQVKKFNEEIKQFDEQMAYYREKDAKEYAMEIKQLELQKQQLEQAKKEADREYQLKKQQLAEEKRQFNASLSEQKRQYNKSYSATYSNGSNGYSNGSSEITTAYYKGEKAKNVGGFGYFNNGYQPKGVTIDGKAYELSKSGSKMEVKSKTLQGTTTTTNQNIWQVTTGGYTYYYLWDGSKNEYKVLGSDKKGQTKTLDKLTK